MRFRPITALIALASIAPVVNAQEKGEAGFALAWTHELREEPATLANGRFTLKGWSFTAYECNASDAMKHWKRYMETLGGAVKGNDPTRSTGAVIGGLSNPVPLVLAMAAKDKEAGGIRVTVAFALNDSVNAPEDVGMPAVLHTMAVKVNRAVVEDQIAEQEKRVHKVTDELAAAQKEEAKASERSQDAGEDLRKVNSKQAKLTKRRADLQKEVGKLQAKYQKKQDPAILEDIAKTQQRLVDVDKDLAKLQKKESDAQKDVNKHQGQIPDAQEHQQKHEAQKERAISELEALKRKMEAVR